jgi:hypothetical protein
MTIEQLMAKIIAGKAADRERAKALPWEEKIKIIERLADAARVGRAAMAAAKRDDEAR